MPVLLTAFLIFSLAWNGAAVVMGVIGVLRRERRRELSVYAGRQALAAAGMSATAAILGGAALAFVPGEIGGALYAAGLFFGALFWAVGGLIPMTVMVLLSGRFHRGGPTPNDRSRSAYR